MTAAYSRDDLLQLAGERSFRHGEGYVDAVSRLHLRNGELCAVVQGGEHYRVRLGIGPTGLDGRCDCPHGEEGFFCEHLVATGLAKLEGLGQGEEEDETDEQLYTYLAGLEQEQLIDLVLDAAAVDERLERQLLDAAYDGAQDDE